MNKLARLLISFGAGYAVGKMLKIKNKPETLNGLFDELRNISIEVPDVDANDIKIVNTELESGKDRLRFEDGKQIVRSETDTRIMETIIGVDGIEIKTTSKIDEMKKEIEELKGTINDHRMRIYELNSLICEVADRIQ